MLDSHSSAIDDLQGGKQVREHSYLHVSLLLEQSPGVRQIVDNARKLARAGEGTFNVVRFSRASQEIGLLNYPRFFEDPFPALVSSCVVNLASKSVRRTDFSMRKNPQILHRKELLLPSAHPKRSQYAKLTAELERRGMFSDPLRIGFQKFWTDQLALRGLTIKGHALVETPSSKSTAEEKAEQEAEEKEEERWSEKEKEIERHRTAIVRDRLSAPMQALARHGILVSERTVLDYGCGQGDDVRALQAGRIPAAGWDPHYAPDAPLAAADIVNIGFVLNVIEEPRERVQAVRRAFELSRQCLSVAVMVVGKGDTSGHRPYRDGFITGRGTFQKYFRQEEIKEFLDRSLGTEAIAVGPGVFFVFKDKILEQRFLLDRQRRIQISLPHELRPPIDRPTIAQRRMETLRPLLARLWQLMLAMGRPLVEEEVPIDLLSEIQGQLGSLRRAERLGRSQFDDQELIAAGKSRREDLLVYFALNLFNGRTRYSTLAPELQRDIKIFFGGGASAYEAARSLLFSVGKSEVIDKACREAASAGLGYLTEGHSLQIHSSQLNNLPAVLRCYVGCAAKLYGDIDTADLVKIHVLSGKLTLLSYNDFESSPLPSLRERIKINMREQRIDFFQYAKDTEQQFLFLKSRYMSVDQPGYERQKRFDDALVKLGLFDFSEYGPSADAFSSTLRVAGYAIGDFRLKNVSPSK